MAVAYVDSTTTGTADAQNSGQNCPVPTGTAADHIAVLVIEVWLDTSTDPIIGWPSGFTQKVFYESTTDGFERVIIGWKRLTAADSGNYAYTITNGTYWNQAQCILVSGCVTTGDPFEATNNAQNSTGTSLPSTSVTVATNPFLLHVIANENSSTKTPPTSFTEAEDANYLEISYRIPGSTGTFTTSGGSTSASTLKLCVLAALKEAGAGGTDLVIQDALHATSADNIVITQQHTLVVQESLHASAVDNLAITQNHFLIVQEASHATTVDNVTITQAHQLAIQDALHASVADSLNITQDHLLVIQDSTHATSAENISLTGIIDLAIQKAIHATTSDTFALTQAHQITIHKSFLQTAADNVTLLGLGGDVVTVTDVQLQKLATLTGITGSIQDLEHAYYGGLSGLAPVGSFSVSDHQRVYWETQTGLSARSLADLEKAFYDAQLVPSGSLADREYVYWSNL